MEITKVTTNGMKSPATIQMDGKTFFIAPVTMIVEGVLVGNAGPLLYNAAVIKDTPKAWNHKPVIVYHPPDGESVESITYLEQSKVGFVLNARTDTVLKKGRELTRLIANAYIDRDKLEQVSPETLYRLENGQVVEVSTGLYSSAREEAGEWDGRIYNAVVTNMIPDHLAILPDQRGACSAEDGCGLLQNKEEGVENMEKENKELIDAVITNTQTLFGEDDRAFLSQLDAEHLQKLLPVQNTEDVEDDDCPGCGGEPQPKPVMNAEEVSVVDTPKSVTLNEYVNAAPPEIRDVLIHGLHEHAAKKSALIGQIVQNKRNKFQKDELADMPIRQLEAIAALVTEETPTQNSQFDFSALGLLANSEVDEEPLTLPVMNFGKEDK